jgi:hypothetical protein
MFAPPSLRSLQFLFYQKMKEKIQNLLKEEDIFFGRGLGRECCEGID